MILFNQFCYRFIRSKVFISFILLFLVISSLLIYSYISVNQRHIILGVWTEGFYDSSAKKLNPEKLLQFEQLIHKKISIAHYYIGWESLSDPELVNQFSVIRENGWEPMLNVNPYYFSGCPPVDLPLYKAIAEGKCDTFLHNAGKNLKQIKEPFYLVFAWEMNNPQNTWSIKYSGSNDADFIDAWRHIHEIFKQEEVKNVIWVFCPNVPNDPSTPYEAIYPGDDYVDWIGLDGYNWGSTQSWSQWDSFAGIFGYAYKQFIKIAPTKQIMIAEVNTTDQGGDKAAWYTDMLTQQIPYNFPKINAIILFNENKISQEHVNWDVDTSPNSLKSFIEGVHSKFYN